MKRGVVIIPKLRELKDGFSGGPVIDPQSFRRDLTYWDQVAIIHLDNILVGSFGVKELPENNEDAKIALEANHLKIETVRLEYNGYYHSKDLANDYRDAQQRTAYNNSVIYNEHWSIGQTIDRISLPDSRSVKEDVITTSLINALPAPGEGATAEDIIHFKIKRKDELDRFRDVYDNFYKRILSAEDQQLELKKSVKELEKILSDLDQLMKEENLNPTQMSLKTLWKTVKNAGASGLLAATFSPDSSVIPVFVGAIEAGITLNNERASVPSEWTEKVEDYAYLSSVKNILK